VTVTFSVNFDYRCPFARNANEHVLAALEAGGDYDVSFVGFSLEQAHVEEGQPPIWDQPAFEPGMTALAAGIVVRDRMPDRFPSVHRELFAARHEHGGDLREREVVAAALERGGADPAAVLAEIEEGWPQKVLREEHERSVSELAVFGVPTFVIGDQAVFVRLMTRPNGDGALARTTVDLVLDLLAGHRELNEYKHTSIPR
jgi:2-hydroxychromene-2-carboxylate isomerase